MKQNKLDRYLNENFSWTIFLSWTFLVSLKYVIIVKQILKEIANEKEPSGSKFKEDLSQKITTIVGENIKINWFASTEMKTFVLKNEIYYSSALENELTEDEIIALLLYEFNAKKKNLKTKENITGHLKFGLPFEIFVSLLYGACPSLMNWFAVLNIAIPIFLDRKYMEYIKKLNTFSGDSYVTKLGYGSHLFNALVKIRTFQRKKLRVSIKNVDEVEKTLDKINISKLEPIFKDRIKNLVDTIAKSQTVLTTNVLYKKMKDLLDSNILKKNGTTVPPEPAKTDVKDPVVEPVELPKKEADKIKLKKESDELYSKVVEYAKTNPELKASDLQIQFKISLSKSQSYIRKLKENKIIDSKYKTVPKILVKNSTTVKPKAVEKPKPEVKPKAVEKPKEIALDQAEYEAIIDFIKNKNVITYELIQRNFRITRNLAVEYVKQLQKDKIINSSLRVINKEVEPSAVKTKEELEAIEYKKVLEFARNQIGVSVSILQKEFQISPSKAKEMFSKLLKDGIINKEGDVLTNSTKINKISKEEAKKNFNHSDKILSKLDKFIEPEEGEDEEASDTGKYKSDNIKKLSKSDLRKRLLNRGK